MIELVLSLIFAAASGAATPCHRTTFQTDLIKNACAKGGQPAAKDVMKQFAKQHHISTCNHCHSSNAPTYNLKHGALDEFHKLGGS